MSVIDHEPEQPPEPKTAASSPAAAPPYRAFAIGLAAVLLLVVALVATAPYWAPLLPWGVAVPTADTSLGPQIASLERRLAALEARPAPPLGDTAEIRAQMATLSRAVATLTERVAAIDRSAQAGAAHAASDTALALTLLQIRGAIAAGRPFVAEYAALAAQVQERPEVAVSVAALAAAAKTGVATRGVLAKGLHDLAGAIARAAVPPSMQSGWGDAVLARLRGLVTVRRIDGAPENGPQGAVAAAETALAGGDLRGAVAELERLAGQSAAVAAPWLGMARARLAVDAALQQNEAALTARLGGVAAAPGPSP